MKYKGYTGVVEFDDESKVLFGRVIGLRDVITFQGESVAEVVQAFHDSVDDYLAFCAERGESPEKPYSGQFVLRLAPELHRALANVAQAQTTSLNALIEGILEKNLHEVHGVHFVYPGIKGTAVMRPPYLFAAWPAPKKTRRSSKPRGSPKPRKGQAPDDIVPDEAEPSDRETQAGNRPKRAVVRPGESL